jgi:DNA repair protein RecN (Recombination protein N)
MLKTLSISNYALIDKTDIEFGPGFSVITGETGAGKSIMLGALGLILGQRSDVSVIRNKEKKCVIEGHFDVSGYDLLSLFKEEDVDYDNEMVIRREILPGGKSRAFVNDTPVNLNFLKLLSDRLIDIHSQHQNLLLGDNHFQLDVVDAVAGNSVLLKDYQESYHHYKGLVREKTVLQELNQKQQSDQDYWTFQLKQLEEASLVAGQQNDLEQELEQLSHVEEIKAALALATHSLSETEQPVVQELYHVLGELRKIAPFLVGGQELVSRLESTYIELKDIADEITVKSEDTEFDPGRLRLVQERLDLIYSLQQKHHVASVEELIQIKEHLTARLEQLASFGEELARLDRQIADANRVVEEKARLLSLSREKVFDPIRSTLETQLRLLGMPFARFLVHKAPGSHFGETGKDAVSFLFSANKSGELTDIPKVASGGEISRVMLCIKALLSSARGLPTIIFDEIDMGVSGEIADRMGRIMQNMAQNIQVVSITHLPQIAGKGSRHFKAIKSEAGHQTISSVKLLTEAERVVEIAGMLSGAQLSEAALENARQLLEN